jgi:energy-coupling factor transporter ATP-binding protein EcfA2
MRIAQLSLAGRGAWPDLHIEQLQPQLNVFFGKPGAGKSTIAQLANHLLYGKAQSTWRQQFGLTVPLLEGHLVVDSSLGSFALRRHLNADRTSRLTVAGIGNSSVDSHTVQKLLGELSPHVLAQLMAVDFAEAPSVEWLLSKDFSQELAKAPGKNFSSDGGNYCAVDHAMERSLPVDRSRIDELIRQRDVIAESIEKQLAMRRHEGGVLSAELDDVVNLLEKSRRQLEAIQADALVTARKITECEVRLRYVSLETTATQQTREHDTQSKRDEINQLEAEITRCRKALSDLQAREATVRAELAQLTPDGTADRVSYLADSRSTLSVLERLVDDLDAEVALLARAHEPGRCVGHDSHAKLSPVAAMLRQQVYTLCGLVTEQERASRRQQLLTESRHISRSQLDLSERLEHLLERRELLVHELSNASQPTLLRPQTPAVEHCRCENHAEFVKHADPLLVGYTSRHPQEIDLHTDHESLIRRSEELNREAARLTKTLAELENRWQDLQRERAGLVGNGSLEELRFQLERLEMTIRETLKPTLVTPASSVATWRASDILSQLTDGKLVQIRLERDGRPPVVIDHLGQALELGALSTAAHDQLYLALTLALVGSFARQGIHLPLILDEPFLRQDAAGSATMAGLLAEFARAGHQVLVFTEDLDALRRFESLNTHILDLAKLRRQVPVANSPETITKETILTRVVRETEDGERTPVLQFQTNDVTLEPQFYLTEGSSLAEFPVLGSGTTESFGKIGITNIGQLIAADASAVAEQLDRKQITAETVGLWQAHMRLMTSVPSVTLSDAQVLAACGIRSFADLRRAVPIELETTIRDFLRSERGQRFAGSIAHFNASQIREWVHLGIHTAKPVSRVHNDNSPDLSLHQPEILAHTPSHDQPEFFLSRASHVANAPSIGPQTAQRLASVGIRTVADLLNANPMAVAKQIGMSHITTESIADWQLQAQLVCQIPDLRGYGAQLLVACGFTSPEQITDSRLADLIHEIQEFAQSKQGQRILRGHEIPSTAKIKSWAQNAALHRPLEAA